MTKLHSACQGGTKLVVRMVRERNKVSSSYYSMPLHAEQLELRAVWAFRGLLR